MNNGYNGKILWVNLSKRKIIEDNLTEDLVKKYLGGYGIGLYIIYKKQIKGIDPLAPESIIGFATGPLTGTPAVIGSRFTVMGKSPLTGTWGDANCGGKFGPYMKKAGYDFIFITGRAEKPVYIYIYNGNPQLKDAEHLWGKNTLETEDNLKEKHGKDVQIASIGPAGERLSLISCIIHDKGKAAARFGLGAVLGSKKLKAIVVNGSHEPILYNGDRTLELRKKAIKQIRQEKLGLSESYMVGTVGYTVPSILNGDSPVCNWSRSSPEEYKKEASKTLNHNVLFKFRTSKYGCWKCPIVCGGKLSLKNTGYQIEETHQPEYETMSAFGPNCLNSNIESIIKANDICNKYGIDTISTGALIAYVMECYEKGYITSSDIDGIKPVWGNSEAIIELTEKIASVEGIGKVLSGGFNKSINYFGQETAPLAIHVKGEGIAMHDPRFEPAMAVIYKMFPGKHIQASQYVKPPGLDQNFPNFGADREQQDRRGSGVKLLECLCNIVNCSGVCIFGYLSTDLDCLHEFLTAATGIKWDMKKSIEVGERISHLRQAYNIREGVNLIKASFPDRALGIPPLKDGPTANFKVKLNTILYEYLDEMDWSHEEGTPSEERLKKLGLDFL